MKNFFTARRISLIAIFAAISFGLYLINIPITALFPFFLELNISDLPALIVGFSLGPISGAITVAIKIAIKLPLSSTGCVGELSDLINGLALVVVACTFYKYHRSKKGALVGLVLGSVASVVTSIFGNLFIMIPAFSLIMPFSAIVDACSVIPGINESNFYTFYISAAVIPFNLLRCILVSCLTFLLYKHIIVFINRFSPLQSYTNSFESNSEKRTFNLGVRFAKRLKAGDVVLLNGVMGAGKTVFTKGIAKGLGIADTITSPTYAYMNEYGDGKLYHYDCYRLSSGEEAVSLGLNEYFSNGGICVVEWPQNIQSVLPKNAISVTIEPLSENRRRIRYEFYRH